MNKGRTFARVRDEGERLCASIGRGQECARLERGEPCTLSHDLKAYLAANQKDSEEHAMHEAGGSDNNHDSRIKSCPVSPMREAAVFLVPRRRDQSVQGPPLCALKASRSTTTKTPFFLPRCASPF